ncbi:hypothetical protein GW17_00058644 [Ensete ventricosum]|nr:hypothetical protein GW17_00058644 [Ensete ventricosum]
MPARGGSRVQQRPRKRQPRMPPAVTHGRSHVQQRPRKRRPRALVVVAACQRLAATQVALAVAQPHDGGRTGDALAVAQSPASRSRPLAVAQATMAEEKLGFFLKKIIVLPLNGKL